MLQWPHRLVVPIGGVPVDTRYVTCIMILYVHIYMYLSKYHVLRVHHLPGLWPENVSNVI